MSPVAIGNAGPADAQAAIAAIHARVAALESRFAGVTSGAGAVDFDAVLARQGGLSYDGLRSAAALSRGTGTDVVSLAERYQGVPYVWGGADPSGFDCSGFVQYVYGQFGVDLPRVAADQAQVGQPVAGLADARPGDLIAFSSGTPRAPGGSPVDHIGIYAGNGMMVVAPHTGDVVKVQPVYDQPTAIRRVLPDRLGLASADRAGLFLGLAQGVT
jgi:peptidoglycan DL-endopeptidase CwlO